MKRWVKILIGVMVVLALVLTGAGLYFYNYAVARADEKDFLASDTPGTTTSQATEKPTEEVWIENEANRTTWSLTSTDGLALQAYYFPAAEETTRNIIAAHGYMGNSESMAAYVKMYHDWGYNVLVPDARGHGRSEGNYIGFGWPERKDYVQWIDQLIEKNGADAQIALFGVSMGGATVMMTSGEKLPDNVKAIVEDCGYSSVNDQLVFQLKELFNLPSFPLVPITSLVTKVRAGYFFGEADAVAQLQKNTRPMLFIHGDADTFVPFSMLETVYEATDAPKEKYIVPGAKHAKGYAQDPEKYQEVVKTFLDKYID